MSKVSRTAKGSEVIVPTARATLFEFTKYEWRPKERELDLFYKVYFKRRGPMVFKERVLLPRIPRVSVPEPTLSYTLRAVHLMLGVSYYKLFVPPRVRVFHKLSAKEARFWNTVYQKGLGEFFYKNNLPLSRCARFKASGGSVLPPLRFKTSNRALVGVGGGKDSIVAAELLKRQNYPIHALVIETQASSQIVDRVVKTMGIPVLRLRRQLDPQLLRPLSGSYKGHIPVSGIYAILGYLAALLYEYRYVIVGNERSSNFGNLRYQGRMVNHQWSKSVEFEEAFQDYSTSLLSPSIVYFSLLRSLYEIRVAELFTNYRKYFKLFSSCNRGYSVKVKVSGADQACLWCGQCPKCVFVFVMLSAFLPKKELLTIFGRNLYDDTGLLNIFGDLLGFGLAKPFDCVGTFEETRVALLLAAPRYKRSVAIRRWRKRITFSQVTGKRVFKVNPAPTVPAFFRFFVLNNVLLAGYGREGQVTRQFLKSKFPKLPVGITDAKDGRGYLKKQYDYEFAVRTPGLPKRFLTVPYTTATNIFFSAIQNVTIGVTGSKGKSTTAMLIFSLLKEAGLPVYLIGNIGKPMLQLLLRRISEKAILIIELSSYQLDDCEYSPHIAVVTNLFPEHMNYHGSVAKYYAAKKNIIEHQRPGDYFFYNPMDRRLVSWSKQAPGIARPFARQIFIKDNELSLPGKHNVQNAKAAVAVAQLFKISPTVIRRVLKKVKPLQHRLQRVGSYRGITFYDDAISTTPQSTIYALDTLKNVQTIFLGGEDRGYNFRDLEAKLRKSGVRNVVLFPKSGSRILRSKKVFN
ncbi:MAG: Mur ligase family protein, partial [Parcubacteria group bacterium]